MKQRCELKIGKLILPIPERVAITLVIVMVLFGWPITFNPQLKKEEK